MILISLFYQRSRQIRKNALTINAAGSIVIESKYILEVVRKIEGEIIEFEVLDDTQTRISGDRSQFKINGMKSTGLSCY